MSKLLSLACVVLLAVPVRADFVIVQRVESGRQSGTVTLKIRQNLARADVAPQLSTLTDAKTGEVITLMHEQKRYMRIPAERTRALREQMQKLQPAAAEPPRLIATGKKEKLAGHECEVFTWNAPGLQATYWIARGFPGYAAVLAAMESSLESGLGALARNLTPRPSDFPGMVIKTELTITGRKVTTTLVSVTEEALAAELFSVPADYQESPTPDFKFP